MLQVVHDGGGGDVVGVGALPARLGVLAAPVVVVAVQPGQRRSLRQVAVAGRREISLTFDCKIDNKASLVQW